MADDLGDFQTPPELVARVLECLSATGRRWERVLEPTCGTGNFIRGLIESAAPPEEVIGIELQGAHLARARLIARSSASTRVEIRRASLFELDLRRDLRWRSNGPLLVIGNPPWVTNSQLGAMDSRNIPAKSNLKRLSGIDALTGSSNFDLAEFIWLKLIRELQDQRPAFALLCKTSVARNVLQFAHDRSIPVASSWIRRLDARKHFKASVDACLFYLEIGEGGTEYETAVFSDIEATQPERVLGFAAGRMVSDLGRYREAASIDGACQFVWRQGIKHDAARVMELRPEGERLINGLGEAVDVEPEYVYYLIKSSDLKAEPRILPRFRVLVTQRRTGEDTRSLESEAPKLWSYLARHLPRFERRKSSVYRNRPPFAMFGIGSYSFSRFKVAVSGLHKEPRFRLVPPIGGRPVMLDDTCYFIACDSARQAALLAALLNHPTAEGFLHCAMFVDSKRPVTKALLKRIDLFALLDRVARREIIADAEEALNQVPDGEAGAWPDDLRILLMASPPLE
jgi:hypothetical protein